jgi:peptidoglycan/LPS O-acetylase OafA/YrhL
MGIIIDPPSSRPWRDAAVRGAFLAVFTWISAGMRTYTGKLSMSLPWVFILGLAAGGSFTAAIGAYWSSKIRKGFKPNPNKQGRALKLRPGAGPPVVIAVIGMILTVIGAVTQPGTVKTLTTWGGAVLVLMAAIWIGALAYRDKQRRSSAGIDGGQD